MCSFGEIVEPGSRNAWEDWDENIDCQSEIKWQRAIEVPKVINTFLILEGRYLADSIKMQVELKLQHINSVPEYNLKLYKTNDSDCYICVLKDYNLLQSSEIVELIKPFVVSSVDIVTILTKPLVEYQVSEILAENHVIRSLSTSKPLVAKSLAINFPRLEQPNIISGVSAGVICLRESMGLPGTAVVCYIEHPEESHIYELQVLLEKLNIVHMDTKPNNILKSNLYI
ncbi:putative proteasome complex [Operophtera brumata]|uniref:Proteasome assembly chaperone 1 n=1 Tax=Operophtera brumata TaxID=104452 RepID=A0A0L7L6C8_OPEBR|nr:putative proteasome complex [Operophtera brumata]